MPEISRFFGIVIRMYAEPAGQHHRPHFHAYYQEAAGIVAIDLVEWIAGSFPVAQRRLVEAWAEIHRPELVANWMALQNGRAASKIEPLR